MSGRSGVNPGRWGPPRAMAFLSAMSDQFFVNAYAETLAPCTGAGSSVTGNSG